MHCLNVHVWCSLFMVQYLTDPTPSIMACKDKPEWAAIVDAAWAGWANGSSKDDGILRAANAAKAAAVAAERYAPQPSASKKAKLTVPKESPKKSMKAVSAAAAPAHVRRQAAPVPIIDDEDEDEVVFLHEVAKQ